MSCDINWVCGGNENNWDGGGYDKAGLFMKICYLVSVCVWCWKERPSGVALSK